MPRTLLRRFALALPLPLALAAIALVLLEVYQRQGDTHDWTLAAAPAVTEAESLAPTSSHAPVVVGDAAASGGKALVFYSNGSVAGSLTTTQNTVRLLVRARGQQCKGAPQLEASVDGTRVLNAYVSSTTYTTLVADVALPAGKHTVSIAFGNDYGTGCDRNLIVDYVSLESDPVEAEGLTPWVAARPADAFVDSVGVNTHLSYSDTVYARLPKVVAALKSAGIRHVRDSLMPNRPDQYRAINALAAEGIRTDLLMGDPLRRHGSGSVEDLVPILKSQVLGAVESVEGPNEFDISGRSNWSTLLGDYQRRLYTTMKDDAALRSIRVLGPSLVYRNSQVRVGDISGSLDRGNFHPYPGGAPAGRQPQGAKTLRTRMTEAAVNSKDKPIVATETGYHNAIHTTDTHPPTSERAAGIYLPKLFLEYFRNGVERTFDFELLDERNNVSRTRRDSNFGLLRNDFSEKPAFASIRGWNQALADPGPSFTPTGLRYALAGDTTDVRSLLFQRRNGTFLLALWREVPVWSTTTRSDLTVPPRPMTVQLGEQVDDAVLSTPATGIRTTMAAPGDSVDVNLGEQAQLLELDP